MRISSQKKILRRFIQKRWMEFIADDDVKMTLPEVSIVPWQSASTRLVKYKKEIIAGDKDGCHVKAITKNGEPEAFIWKTSPDKIAQGVRWGVIRAQSITGQVISTLGRYRLAAHEIIAKGMVSNTHLMKMQLLDVYQDRFTLLQELESLVNQKDMTVAEINLKLEDYKNQLILLRDKPLEHLPKNVVAKIHEDITQDIQRAETFRLTMNNRNDPATTTSARGYYTMMEFIKSQMITNLYELQGINQDISFDKTRTFALTRGRLNDAIEDARHAINAHHPDYFNLVSEKHHGIYNKDENKIIYDFSTDKLSPEQERKAMLAVSFIEGWDKVVYDAGKPKLQNDQFGEIDLKVIAATRWRTSRDWRAFFRKIGVILLNMVKSFVVPTKPWKEDAWEYTKDDKRFRPIANELYDHSRLNKPLWHTPYHAIKRFILGFKDVFYGIYNTGKILLKTPFDLVFDWYAAKALPTLDKVIEDANHECDTIHVKEVSNLQVLLNQVEHKTGKSQAKFNQQIRPNQAITVAYQDYHLSTGDTNDILNSLVRGLTEFSEVFTDLFHKNPVAGTAFCTTYGVAALTILAPTYVAFLGPKFLAFQNTVGYTLGGSKFAATISVASIESQVMALAVDAAAHGPTGTFANIGYEFFKNPLQLTTFGSMSYGVAYLLSETGIPGIGDVLHDEMNGVFTNYLILGIKTLVITHALFHKDKEYKFVQSNIKINGEWLEQHQAQLALTKTFIDRFRFVKWLSDNHHKITKLPVEMRCNIERHIDALFPDKDEAHALHKLVRREKKRSIAYQFLAIPLGYIPAIFRIIISLPICLVAAIYRHPYPMQPFYNSLKALGTKTVRDMASFVVFTAELSRLIVNNFVSLIKMLTYVAVMAVGRIGSLFGWQPGHTSHRFFAFMHRGLRTVGEVLYPTFAAKQLTSGNPASVMNKYEHSYLKLVNQIDFKNAVIETNPAATQSHPAAIQGHPAAIQGHPAAIQGHPAACPRDPDITTPPPSSSTDTFNPEFK